MRKAARDAHDECHNLARPCYLSEKEKRLEARKNIFASREHDDTLAAVKSRLYIYI